MRLHKRGFIRIIDIDTQVIFAVPLFRGHLVYLWATSCQAPTSSFRSLDGSILLLILLSRLILILRGSLLRTLAMISSPFEQCLVGLLRLLALDILQLFRMNWIIWNCIVRLLKVLVVAIDDGATSFLCTDLRTNVILRLAVLLLVYVQRIHHILVRLRLLQRIHQLVTEVLSSARTINCEHLLLSLW